MKIKIHRHQKKREREKKNVNENRKFLMFGFSRKTFLKFSSLTPPPPQLLRLERGEGMRFLSLFGVNKMRAKMHR